MIECISIHKYPVFIKIQNKLFKTSSLIKCQINHYIYSDNIFFFYVMKGEFWRSRREAARVELSPPFLIPALPLGCAIWVGMMGRVRLEMVGFLEKVAESP